MHTYIHTYIHTYNPPCSISLVLCTKSLLPLPLVKELSYAVTCRGRNLRQSFLGRSNFGATHGLNRWWVCYIFSPFKGVELANRPRRRQQAGYSVRDDSGQETLVTVIRPCQLSA